MVGGLRSEFDPIVPILDRLPIPPLRRILSVFSRLREYGKVAVENARSASKNTLFTKILTQPESTSSMSEADREVMIADEASNFMIGGTDTTSCTLTYLIWALLRDPEIKHTLVTELNKLPQNPTNSELESSTYLNNVIEETLRLYSAVRGSLRRTNHHRSAVLAGYMIPPKTVVSTQAYTFHRDPRVFIEPDRFNPNRWVDATQQMLQTSMAWGAGSRTCLRLHLA